MDWRTALLVIICIPLVTAEITEIHANPEGRDDTKEFVEVDHPNLSGHTVGDTNSNDTLTKQQNGSEYAMIVEEGHNYDTEAQVYIAGATIGNGLSNGGDTVYLYRNGTLVHNLSYNEVEEGKSLQKYDDDYIEASPSPGQAYTPPCDTTLEIEVGNRTYRANSAIPYRYEVSGTENFTIRQYVTSEDGERIDVSNVTNEAQMIRAVDTNEPTQMRIYGELAEPGCNATASTRLLVQEGTRKCTKYKQQIDDMSERIAEMQYLLSQQPRVKTVLRDDPDLDVSIAANTTRSVTFHVSGNGSVQAFHVVNRTEGPLPTLPGSPGNQTYLFLLGNGTDVYDAHTVSLAFPDTRQKSKNGSDESRRNSDIPFPNQTNARPPSPVLYEEDDSESALFSSTAVGALALALIGGWRVVTHETL